MLIHHASDLDHRIYQRLWRDDVAEAQGGIENLTHRSGVDHPVEVVEPLQGRQGRPGKAELRVEVVFKNKGVVSMRKIKQGSPKGKLMGRRYVDDSRQRLVSQSRDHHSFMVDRLRHYFSADKSKDSSGLVKTGIFNPRSLAGIYQRHCADHHCLLHSGDDHDLIRMTARPSKIAQIGCDRLTQVGVATVRRIAQ